MNLELSFTSSTRTTVESPHTANLLFGLCFWCRRSNSILWTRKKRGVDPSLAIHNWASAGQTANCFCLPVDAVPGQRFGGWCHSLRGGFPHVKLGGGIRSSCGLVQISGVTCVFFPTVRTSNKFSSRILIYSAGIILLQWIPDIGTTLGPGQDTWRS